MTQAQQAALIRLGQAVLGLIWLCAIVASVVAGGASAPLWVAVFLSAVTIAAVAYLRNR